MSDRFIPLTYYTRHIYYSQTLQQRRLERRRRLTTFVTLKLFATKHIKRLKHWVPGAETKAGVFILKPIDVETNAFTLSASAEERAPSSHYNT